MHFPTSLPKTSGSPVAKIDFSPPYHNNHNRQNSRLSVHAEVFDGPQPPPHPSERRQRGPRASRTLYSQRINPPSAVTPVYSYALPQWASSHADLQDLGKPPSKPYMSGALHAPKRASIDPRRPFRSLSRKRSTEISEVEVPATDGHGDKMKSKLKAPVFKNVFQKKGTKSAEKLESELPPSSDLTEKAIDEFLHASKKTHSRKHHSHSSGSRDTPQKRSNSSRRKKNIDNELDLEDSDHHPFEGARKRMNDERMRKMRRASTSSNKSVKHEGKVDMNIPSDAQVNQHDHDRHRHSVSETVKEMTYRPIDKYEAYRSSVQLEKEDMEDGVMGSRVGNAVRRMSATFMGDEEEKNASSRRASWTRRPSNEPQAIDSTSSSSPERMPEHVDFGSYDPLPVPNIVHSVPTSPRTRPSSADQTNHPYGQVTYQQPAIRQEPQLSLYGVPPAPPKTNPYAQVMYPPRPAPYFRPTLSPVSSRSPVPTSLGQGVSPSPGKEKSRPVSVSPVQRIVEKERPASSLRHPVPNLETVPLSKVGGLVVRNGLPTSSPSSSESAKSSPRKSPILTPIVEVASPEKEPSVGKGGISPLVLSPQIKGRAEKVQHQELPLSSKINGLYASPLSAMSRPQSPPPEHTPSPLKVTAKTPTSSALEFWREADESLAPSDSASAQPPNYRREPAATSSFWKAADQSFTLRKTGPSMEEWIASLPGLGLGLGPWGNSDGALDWKVFETIRAKSKLSKSSKSASSKGDKAKLEELEKLAPPESSKITIQELIDQSIERLSEVAEEIEADNQKIVFDEDEAANMDDGLTPDEAEAIEEDDEDLSARNRPPPVIDRSLLHPTYRPGDPSYSPPTSSFHEVEKVMLAGQEYILPTTIARGNGRSKNLARDVESRLDALEKYWSEQVVIMGTVYKKMLVLVDNMIIKEREQAQRQARRRQMGWTDYEEEEDAREAEEKDSAIGEDAQQAEIPSSCSLT